ncbi:MAG: glutamate--tRNA ligase family protein, partial [Defluviitaleaceae bacterium]|nr:glutamate--tRNA ligase family protein [Defluviitaleaceae bacterium]
MSDTMENMNENDDRVSGGNINGGESPAPVNFLYRIIEDDIANEVYHRPICTRYPPEPNGYMHIGHLWSVNLHYTAARKYNGKFNLRFDDTNPLKEDMEYVNAIIADMKWAGYDSGENI